MDINIDSWIVVKLYPLRALISIDESTIKPAKTDPRKTPIPFRQFIREENLITSSSAHSSYTMLNEDRPNPEKLIPASKLIIKEIIILPFVSK